MNEDSNKNNLLTMRHSAEHVLMHAMKNLYGDKITMAMGPATDEGFYFDFDTADDFQLSDSDFAKIEAEMAKIISADLPIKKEEIGINEAREMFKDNPYKQEWLDEIEAKGEPVTIYRTGDDFVDLCSGPHVESTGKIGPFKLLSIAGAYWHGDEKNKMLTRIYGTAFPTQKELDKYLWLREEAKKRDHRKLGIKLDLFTFSDLVGSGFPLYTPKGALVRRLINEYVEEIQSKQGYTQVWTPQIAKAELFKKSGHYHKYKEDMFRVVSNYSEEEFYLKPMNCPQHTQIYASRPRSYRDLPLRYSDFAMLYRDEKPGELSGLARVRAFSQDDLHIFCREDQVDEEIDKALAMTKEIMATYGFSYRYRLSVRDPQHPEKYIGDPKDWDRVEKWAEVIMQRNNIDHYVGVGEAAFYAPKMDLMATDALGREWQLSTVQIDMFMPERFDLTYTDSDGAEKRPVMIHRAIIGSPERFLMILLEHFEGAFPLWLAPVQLVILPISENQLEYASTLADKLKEDGIRVEIDDSNRTLGKKMALAIEQKPPYIAVIGQKEAEQNTVTLRSRAGKQQAMDLSSLTQKLQTEIANKSLS